MLAGQRDVPGQLANGPTSRRPSVRATDASLARAWSHFGGLPEDVGVVITNDPRAGEAVFRVTRLGGAAASVDLAGGEAASAGENRVPGCPWGCVCEIITVPNPADRHTSSERATMSVYRVIDVVGTSTTSWEEAAADAINTARQSVRDLRVAEIVKQDIHIGDGGELIYRTRIQLSFKYETEA